MKRVITFFLALTMAISLVACGNKSVNDGVSSSDDMSQSPPPATDKTEFEPVSLGDFSAQDFDGNTVTKDVFADYDLTMINLWTTTCGYCIEEMPVLNELRKEIQNDSVRFNIISVCMDIGNTEKINEANLNKAKEIIEKAGVEYLNLIPDNVLLEGRLKGIQAFPESFFVDRQGNVVSEPYVGAMSKNHWHVTMDNEIKKNVQNENEE